MRLSKKFGLNPTLGVCFYCGGDTGVVGLLGDNGGKEANKHTVLDREPCAQCADWMKQGVILISVRAGESGDNPYRTGKFAVVKDEVIAEVVDEPLATEILKRRTAFVPDDAWELLGLPSENTE